MKTYHEMCQIADSESEMLDITIEEARAENRFLKETDKPEEHLICPFCKMNDFDRIGLKLHYERGYCDDYNDTPMQDS